MSYQSSVASHNVKVRLLLFFLRPFHIFGVVLLVKMWNMLSYGPASIPGFFGHLSAVQATQILWRDEFSVFIWYFILAAALDIGIQEILPLIVRK